MSLTVTERDHWKLRIGARIDNQISRIKLANKATFDGLKIEARKRAVEALGITALEKERAHIKEKKEQLDKRDKLLTRRIAAATKGVDLEEVSINYHTENEIAAAISKRLEFELESLYGEDPEGTKILALRREKESLLDTVWLATSSAQIKELWSKLTEVLGDETTLLQKQALAIQPAQ